MIELTRKTVEQAVDAASISQLLKNDKTGLAANPNDRWFLDFRLERGKRGEPLIICIGIDHNFDEPPFDHYTLSCTPKIIGLEDETVFLRPLARKPTPEDAKAMLRAQLKCILEKIAERGVKYRRYCVVINDGEDCEAGDEWILGGQVKLYFEENQSGRGKNSESWKVLQNY